MNATHHIKRRTFLRSASIAAGLITVMERLRSWHSSGAEGAAMPDAAETVLAEMEAKGGNFLNVARKDGQFLRLLIQATRAKNVLEVGTSHGYSAIWISLGLEESGGKMATLEILPERVELAKKHLARAGLSHRVTFTEGDAHKIVPTLQGSFDFVFLDGDKDGSMDYFNRLYPQKLSPGAIIAVHNAIQRAEAMKDYLAMIRRHPNFDSVILSLTMDDAFSVSYRRRA